MAATKRFPFLLGHAEIASLYSVERQTSQLWKTRGVLKDPDAVISGNPYWLLPSVQAIAVKGEREVDPARLKEYKQQFDGGYVVSDPDDLPDVIGLKEIPWLFGKKYMDVYQWRVRSSLAPEDATISGSPLWLLQTVLDDAEARKRPVLPEAIDRIRAGEREQIKPRGRKKAETEAVSRTAPPTSRSFSPGEKAEQTEAVIEEAAAFVAEALRCGHSVTVRPKR
uniref:Uncharacterized protein n=1 Tax=Streptomyces sp. NBC_00003 TaxID=2903608 RepID=A0AAU2V7Z1_9ACTN